MIRSRTVLLLIVFLPSLICAGIKPPIKNEFTEKYIELSDCVFEATLDSVEEVYYHDKRRMSESELSDFKTYMKHQYGDDVVWWSARTERYITPTHTPSSDPFADSNGESNSEELPIWASIGEDGRKFKIEYITVRRTVNLKVTKSIKGKHKVGSIVSFEFLDDFGSTCPHSLMLGDYREKQRYFVLKDYLDKEYEYSRSELIRYQTTRD